MTRPLRKGDRVTLTGTVTHAGGATCDVALDNDSMRLFIPVESLTLIAPAEPPVGSVVVKDGVAYTRGEFGDVAGRTWYAPATCNGYPWDVISDGDVIFEPGGGA